ncbi:MAG: DUF4157 domain-containing protein [Spirulina sp.]
MAQPSQPGFQKKSAPSPVAAPSQAMAPRPFAPQTDVAASDVQALDLAAPNAPALDSAPTFPKLNFQIRAAGGSPPPLQPKLTIGAPNDKYEQEADRVAAQVVQRIHAPTANPPNENRTYQAQSVQRQAWPEQPVLKMKSTLQRETLPDEEDELQMKPMIQRLEMSEDDGLQMKPMPQRSAMPPGVKLQMKSAFSEGVVEGNASPDLEAGIQRARGNGQALASTLQMQMGQAMGADFSGVRVHTDSQSDQLNRSIQAKAFTTGQDIFFRQGAYQPENRGGQELIAHELTHVVQQNGGAVQRSQLDHKSNRQPGSALQEARMGEERQTNAMGGRSLPINPTLTSGSLTEKKSWVGASEVQPVVLRWPEHKQPWLPTQQEDTGAQKAGAESTHEMRVDREDRAGEDLAEVGETSKEKIVHGEGRVEVKVRMNPPSIQAFKFPYGTITIDTEQTDPTNWSDDTKTRVAKSLRMWREAGIHPLTNSLLTIQDEREINAFIKKLSVTRPNRRALFGYNNPPHDSAIGLDLLEGGANTPYDPNRWPSREDWLLSPNRNFITYSPNSRTQDPVFMQGHGNVVFGHDMGASVHFNQTGHTQSPGTNRAWNQQLTTYHGLERRDKSNASGANAPEYQQPSQLSGSHPMYWDRNDPRYNPKFRQAFQ